MLDPCDLLPSDSGSIDPLNFDQSSVKSEINIHGSDSNLESSPKRAKLDLTCQICYKSFTSKKGLKNHILRHQDERGFHCDICTFAFKTRRDLSSHKKFVHGRNKFRCVKCLLEFKNKNHGERHISCHTNTPNFN